MNDGPYYISMIAHGILVQMWGLFIGLDSFWESSLLMHVTRIGEFSAVKPVVLALQYTIHVD